MDFPQISQFLVSSSRWWRTSGLSFFFFFPKFPSEELREKKPDFLGLLKIYIQVFFTQIKSATSYFHFSAAFPFIFFSFSSSCVLFLIQPKAPKPKEFREFGDSGNLGIQLFGIWVFWGNSLLIQLFKSLDFPVCFFFFSGISQCLWSAPGWSMGTWGSSPWPGWRTLGQR